MKKLYEMPEIDVSTLMITDVLWGSGEATDEDWIIDVPDMDNILGGGGL